MTNSASPVTARCNEYINNAIAELHDILIGTFEDYYLTLQTISVVAGTSSYALPADFYKALKVFGVNGSERYRLQRYQLDEAESFQDSLAPLARDVSDLSYRIMGANIRFLPTPNVGGSVELWYAPAATKLVGESDTLTVYAPVGWWEEFVALAAAIRLRVREESDASQLMALMAQLRQRIVSSAEERDSGEPQRITDLSGRLSRRRHTHLLYR
jgi:hypothetical protein